MDWHILKNDHIKHSILKNKHSYFLLDCPKETCSYNYLPQPWICPNRRNHLVRLSCCWSMQSSNLSSPSSDVRHILLNISLTYRPQAVWTILVSYALVVDKLIKNCYLSVLIAIGDAQVWHGTQDGDQRLDCVAVHHRPVLFEVFIRKATFVDNSVDKQSYV